MGLNERELKERYRRMTRNEPSIYKHYTDQEWADKSPIMIYA